MDKLAICSLAHIEMRSLFSCSVQSPVPVRMGKVLRCFAAPWTYLWPHSDFHCTYESNTATYWTVQAKAKSADQGKWVFSCPQHFCGHIWNTVVSLFAPSTTATRTNQSKPSSWLQQCLTIWSRWCEKRCWRNCICLALRREGFRGI